MKPAVDTLAGVVPAAALTRENMSKRIPMSDRLKIRRITSRMIDEGTIEIRKSPEGL